MSEFIKKTSEFSGVFCLMKGLATEIYAQLLLSGCNFRMLTNFLINFISKQIRNDICRNKASNRYYEGGCGNEQAIKGICT